MVPYGDDGVLVELPGLAAVHALHARLSTDPPEGVVDVVPAARTVLVRGNPRTRARWAGVVTRAARAAVDDHAAAPATRTVAIPVVYDGADLDDVAQLTGLTVDEVVARHLAGGPDGYRVAFGGFMPGFAYVAGLDPVLHVPRLSSPRTRVPAGSVAVAGDLTAVYPAPTPGGWRLLGRTDLPLFDVSRGVHDAAALRAGDEVRFVRAQRELVTSGARGACAGHPGDRCTDQEGGDGGWGPWVRVVASGALALVEDAGRVGAASVGVPWSGAADPAAMRCANRLVGNASGAAGIEVVLGGLVVTFGATTAFALVGADPGADLDGMAVPVGAAVRAPTGATLRLGVPVRGLRTWLAVRGGIDVPPVLGSRSRDVLSGLGPAPLRAGDVLAYGTAFDGLPQVPDPEPVSDSDPAGGSDPAAGLAPDPVVDLPATDGPRLDHLDEGSRVRLWSQTWRVTVDSNRVAVRLDGAPLTRTTRGELASEGLVAGAVQVPHDGRPVVFGPDHPVTGGYPVVAVLTAVGVARAAQLRPGDRVRLARP